MPASWLLSRQSVLALSQQFSRRTRSLSFPQHRVRRASTALLPSLSVPNLSSAQENKHIDQLAEQLRNTGLVKISLAFSDPDSNYLKHILHSLNQQHGHNLPIDHSSTRGWFWDVRPLTIDSSSSSNGKKKLARSETDAQFPWHTDCSYESHPPQYFALQVMQADQCGGGTLSILNVQQIIKTLSTKSRLALMQPDYTIKVPPEFIKQESQTSIQDRLLAIDAVTGSFIIRLRDDIVTTTNPDAANALNELRSLLASKEMLSKALHLPSEMLPTNSVVLIDNRLWLHSRSEIRDLRRHLRRVRWNARSFP